LYSYLEKIWSYKSDLKKTGAINAIHEIAEKIHKRSLVIIFSDMLDNKIHSNTDELFSALKHLKHNKHEVILFHTVDAEKEIEFKFENRPYQFIDLESGAKLKLNPSEVKEVYLQKIQAYKKELYDKCAQYRIDVIDADIRKGFDQILMPYIIKRSKLK
jgi:flavorubredoxin